MAEISPPCAPKTHGSPLPSSMDDLRRWWSYSQFLGLSVETLRRSCKNSRVRELQLIRKCFLTFRFTDKIYITPFWCHRRQTVPSFLIFFSLFLLSIMRNLVTWLDPIKRGAGGYRTFSEHRVVCSSPSSKNITYLWKLAKGGGGGKGYSHAAPYGLTLVTKLKWKRVFGLECKMGLLTCFIGLQCKISFKNCFFGLKCKLIKKIYFFLEWEISAKRAFLISATALWT